MRAQVNPQVNMLALATRVQPQPVELQSARLHRASARARLEKSFDVSGIVPIGSHVRGTAVRWFSDLDMLVVLRRNEAKWGGDMVSSNTVLGRVIDELGARFASTKIGRDGQAVVVAFAAGQQSLDVVPAFFQRFDSMRPVYLIPDGAGGWFETGPQIHDRYFAVADLKSGGKLKKLSQLIKWWKYSRAKPIPILTFHLDMLLANSSIAVGVKPYTHCVYQAFKLLADRECRGLRDPCQIAGTIYAAQTTPQWEILNDSVKYALEHSTAALAAEAVRDFSEANRQWNIVFNGEF